VKKMAKSTTDNSQKYMQMVLKIMKRLEAPLRREMTIKFPLR
jgi:hypothetical protein